MEINDPGIRPARYVEAPHEYDGGDEPRIFLAGGITRCPDWQSTAVELLADLPVVILNPRRSDFRLTDDPTATENQIRWEHRHLERAQVVLFWFAEGPSVQPIALYELGALAASRRRIAVGTHPSYIRRSDVRIQLALSRPDVTVHSSLAATVAGAVDALP
jgi:Nucleoside 2-deoxyribosyltransferase like